MFEEALKRRLTQLAAILERFPNECRALFGCEEGGGGNPSGRCQPPVVKFF
jgi:hypothetical protein